MRGLASPAYLCLRLKPGEKQLPVEPALVLVQPELRPVNITVYIPTVTLCLCLIPLSMIYPDCSKHTTVCCFLFLIVSDLDAL